MFQDNDKVIMFIRFNNKKGFIIKNKVIQVNKAIIKLKWLLGIKGILKLESLSSIGNTFLKLIIFMLLPLLSLDIGTKKLSQKYKNLIILK